MAYLTAANFRSWRDIDSTDDDTTLTTLISAAQKAIDNYCNRTFEGESEERVYDAPHGRTLHFDTDVASITSITNGDGTTVDSTEYVTKPKNAVAKGVPMWAIKLKSNSAAYWRSDDGDFEDAITVDAVFAYSATPPDDIVHAAFMLTAFYYDSLDSIGGEINIVPGVSVSIPQGMPAAVKQILDEYVREF